MWRALLIVVVLGLWGAAAGWVWDHARMPGRFPLRMVKVVGAARTTPDAVESALRIPRGTNLLLIDPEAVRERLERLPWIRQANVARQFPGTVIVSVAEKNPVCLSRDGERLVLLDEYGLPIKPLEAGDPLVLPVITSPGGEEGARRTVILLNLLNHNQWLTPLISEAIAVTDHNWGLRTTQGVEILLNDADQGALDLLRMVQERHQIMDRAILRVDLRISGVVMVKPIPGIKLPEPQPAVTPPG